MHDLIPLDSKCGYRGLRKQIYLLKLSQIRNALAIFTTTLYVKEQIDNVIRGSVQVYPVFGFINESFVHGKGEWSRDIKLPSKFIVAVGTGECRKNIDSILEVYAYDIDHHKLPHLVLFGKSWGALGHKYIYKKAKSLNVADKILLVGAVTDEELCYLYNQCSIFVYPSLSEGFGLPPIEALACGAKVIVSDLPVFRETLKRNVKYVDPDDALGFHNAIVKTMRQSVVIPSRLLEQYSRKNAKRNVLLFMCNIVNELG